MYYIGLVRYSNAKTVVMVVKQRHEMPLQLPGNIKYIQ